MTIITAWALILFGADTLVFNYQTEEGCQTALAAYMVPHVKGKNGKGYSGVCIPIETYEIE